MKNLYGFFTVCIFAMAASFVSADAIDNRIAKACGICHASGVAGAPKTGDTAAWKPRMDKGMDQMVESVVKGMGAMPPRGMCADCSTDDYKAIIKRMSGL
jgi:cytochrome c5